MSAESSQDRTTSPNIHSNSLANLKPAWRKGQSGNPGGFPKAERVDIAYMRLISLSPDEIANFEPKTGAEIIAFKQFVEACSNKKSLAYAQEITNRTSGVLEKKVVVKQELSDSEQIVARFIERYQSKTGVLLSREDAIERIVSYKPELADSLK